MTAAVTPSCLVRLLLLGRRRRLWVLFLLFRGSSFSSFLYVLPRTVQKRERERERTFAAASLGRPLGKRLITARTEFVSMGQSPSRQWSQRETGELGESGPVTPGRTDKTRKWNRRVASIGTRQSEPSGNEYQVGRSRLNPLSGVQEAAICYANHPAYLRN